MDERWQKIAALDLQSVRRKFEFNKGLWWRLGHSPQRVEEEYRQFLYLIVCNPDSTVVPWSRDLDDFWHQHILDTARYAQDCDTILGRFIHHNPHLPEGSPAYNGAFDATRRMYRVACQESRRKRNGGETYDVEWDESDVPSALRYPRAFPVNSSGGSHHSTASHHTSGHSAASHGGHLGHGGHSSHGCGGHGGGHGCGGHGGH